MASTPDFAQIAGLMAEPSRAAMLLKLLDGRPLTAKELAESAKVTPSTASSHLSKLVGGNLVITESQGRYRYFRLANHNVAHAIESLIAIASPATIHSLRESEEATALRAARTCYDHLAGHLGVAFTDSLLKRGVLRTSGDNFEVSDGGRLVLTNFGLDLTRVRRRRRKFIHACRDWSEHRPHVGGSVGAAILDRIIELDWIQRQPSSRVVKVTDAGKHGLYQHFGLEL